MTNFIPRSVLRATVSASALPALRQYLRPCKVDSHLQGGTTNDMLQRPGQILLGNLNLRRTVLVMLPIPDAN
jgi:hypothetical protein